MSDLFSDEDLSQFAGDISKWNVSKVTNMWVIFKGSQFTGDLNKWKVSDGTDMEDAFMDSALEKIGKIPKWYKPKEDFFLWGICTRLHQEHVNIVFFGGLFYDDSNHNYHNGRRKHPEVH